MNEMLEMYQELGISPAVYAYGEQAIARLRERFDAIDQIAEYNQAKVLSAFEVGIPLRSTGLNNSNLTSVI